LRVAYGDLINGGVPEELAEILRRLDGANDLASVAGANASRGPAIKRAENGLRALSGRAESGACRHQKLLVRNCSFPVGP